MLQHKRKIFMELLDYFLMKKFLFYNYMYKYLVVMVSRLITTWEYFSLNLTILKKKNEICCIPFQVPWQRQTVWTVPLDSIVRELEMSSQQDSVTRDSGVEGNLSRDGRTTRGISPSSMELPSKQSLSIFSSSWNIWELNTKWNFINMLCHVHHIKL